MNFLQVLQGITLPEMDILDNFEDVEYERRTVDVALMVSIIQLSMFKYEIYNCSSPYLCVMFSVLGQFNKVLT